MTMTPSVLFDLSGKTALLTGGATGIGRMATTGLMAAGRLNSDSAFSGRRLGAFPAYRGTPWFLPLVGRYYQLRDWLERRRDGRA